MVPSVMDRAQLGPSFVPSLRLGLLQLRMALGHIRANRKAAVC